MSDIRILPVTTRKGLRTFIQFYYDLYEGSKYAVPYLRFDEWNTLSKGKNPAFDFCEAQYFLAIDYSIASDGSTSSITWKFPVCCWMPQPTGAESVAWKNW